MQLRCDDDDHSQPRYHHLMQRLLKIGTFLFLITIFLAPLAELFDRWDAPGLTHDTEFALFALLFILCLVLLVSRLVASAASAITETSERVPRTEDPPAAPRSAAARIFLLPPLLSPPLRI